MTNPLFSVVMPTRNRCRLLPYAIKSVLGQSLTDLELIVSDNFSDDETAKVVRGFDDPRIKYVRADRSLTIGESYQFALSHATGEHISFISDDDAYAPTMLERVKQVIDQNAAKVVAFRFATYYHNDDFELNRKIPANTLTFPECTGGATKFSPADASRFLYRKFGLNDSEINTDYVALFLSNAVYHCSVIADMQRVKRDIFDAVPADMYFTAALFFVIDSYYCLDLPLYVWSNWTENTTASPHKTRNELRERYERLLDGKELRNTPLKYALPENCCINEILQARKDFRSEAVAPVSWPHYYINSFEYLMNLRNAGVDVQNEMEQFKTVLANEPDNVRQQVNSSVRSVRFISKQFLRKFQPLIRLAKKILDRRQDRHIFVNGNDGRFVDVCGAAEILDQRIESMLER